MPANTEISHSNVAVSIRADIVEELARGLKEWLDSAHQTRVSNLLRGFKAIYTHVRTDINKDGTRSQETLQRSKLGLNGVSKEINAAATVARAIESPDHCAIFQSGAQKRGTRRQSQTRLLEK